MLSREHTVILRTVLDGLSVVVAVFVSLGASLVVSGVGSSIHLAATGQDDCWDPGWFAVELEMAIALQMLLCGLTVGVLAKRGYWLWLAVSAAILTAMQAFFLKDASSSTFALFSWEVYVIANLGLAPLGMWLARKYRFDQAFSRALGGVGRKTGLWLLIGLMTMLGLLGAAVLGIYRCPVSAGMAVFLASFAVVLWNRRCDTMPYGN